MHEPLSSAATTEDRRKAFDTLVRKERLARARVTEFLESAGMSAAGNVRNVIESRDRVMAAFNGLVDAELQVLAEKEGQQISADRDADYQHLDWVPITTISAKDG